MLTKRTNILFDESTWVKLANIAEQENVSVSELIRRAVRETYNQEEQNKRAQQAYQDIVALRKKTEGKVNYRQLIEYGRRF